MQTRFSARAIVMNPKGEVLLIKFHFQNLLEKEVLWITPGGGLKDGEDFETALKRELFEELGVNVNGVGSSIGVRQVIIKGRENDFLSYEKFFLVKINNLMISQDYLTEKEKRSVIEYKWWNVDELMQANEEFRPVKIGALVQDLKLGILIGEIRVIE